MSEKYFAKQVRLHADEEIIAILHSHPVTYAKQIVITAILILSAFFLMFALFSLGQIGVAIFCALILTGLFYGWREFFLWYANVSVITTQRVVDLDRQGFFHKTVSDLALKNIQDISYAVRGISQAIFKIGNIKIQATGATLLLKNIEEVDKVNQLLTDLIREETGKEIEAQKVASLNPKVKEKITEEFLQQAENAKYDDYKLSELIEEYKETFGELSFKKLLIEELEIADDEPAAEDLDEDPPVIKPKEKKEHLFKSKDLK